jgi:hypothetical protein
MRPFQLSFLLFAFFAASCASSRQSPDSSQIRNYPLEIKAKESYQQNAPVHIVVRNTSSQDTIQLYKPRNLVIEKKENDQWVHIRTLYCPCGASCPAPPQKQPLYPGRDYTYRWDQMEEWCGEMTAEGIPEMNRQFPGYGAYRMAIRIFKEDERKVETLYQSFTLTK